MKKLKKLPFFLPLAGCRNQCVYCDQRAITGTRNVPSPADVRQVIRSLDAPREICFFGGSFCRFPISLIKEYLDCAAQAPRGSCLRFSTYPGDLRDDALRALIKNYPISRIELGIPTLDTDVLSACHREADPQKILEEIKILKSEGLPIGVQMMIGLPEQSLQSSISDLRAIARVKGAEPWELRLYPCLVIAGTELSAMYEHGQYRPLSVDEAVSWGGKFLDEALALGFVPIRIGLQETNSLAASVLSGPHHPALGELILAEASALRMSRENPKGPWQAPKREISRFFGHKRFGIKRLAYHAKISEEEAARLLKFI